MFETYYEIEHKKMTEDGFTDYKDISGKSCIYAICKCEGKISNDKLPCSRNPETVYKYDKKVCIWFLTNGSEHCGHRWETRDKKNETI